MANKRVIHEDYITAGSPEATAETLQQLSKSDVSAVRRRVAENNATPEYVLATMSLDQDPQVRIAIGLNVVTPLAVLSRLIGDEDCDVRYWLASTSYLPLYSLIELRADSNPYVSERAGRTIVRVQAGASQRKSTIFEFLEQDHALLIRKLEKLLEHYSKAEDTAFDETIDIFDRLRRHFERQQDFCVDEFLLTDPNTINLLAKCADGQNQIDEEIDALIRRHINGESNSCSELRQLLELVKRHIEFAEKDLFIQLKRQICWDQTNLMNIRLNQALSETCTESGTSENNGIC